MRLPIFWGLPPGYSQGHKPHQSQLQGSGNTSVLSRCPSKFPRCSQSQISHKHECSVTSVTLDNVHGGRAWSQQEGTSVPSTVTGKNIEHQKPQARCSQGLWGKTPKGSILKSHFFRLWDPLARTNIYRYKLFHELFGKSFLSFPGSQQEGQEPSVLGEILC